MKINVSEAVLDVRSDQKSSNRFTSSIQRVILRYSYKLGSDFLQKFLSVREKISSSQRLQRFSSKFLIPASSERGDVPGWVLVVLMTTGLVTAIWTIAAPRLTSILKNSLDAMNGIR